ncbi:MAG TPA: phenylacetate--CoA ligase family protein, partial [Candidatus Eisenbacteria bacterium]
LDPRPCACGRTLPKLRDIQGRATDFLTASDGGRVHALALIYVLRETPGIESFRVVQEAVGSVRVLVVAGDRFAAESERRVVDGVRARLGEGTRVAIERVERLDRERSGKFRYVISRI